jgi:hypothetical protein
LLDDVILGTGGDELNNVISGEEVGLDGQKLESKSTIRPTMLKTNIINHQSLKA